MSKKTVIKDEAVCFVFNTYTAGVFLYSSEMGAVSLRI